jgi:type II secretory pathway component PulJ
MPAGRRRGITLVEMLVSVALLVLMMSVIVQVFTAATGALSAARTYQELDNSLRQLDATLRTDLANVTARLTPPLNPKDNLGYFEYIENSFADSQGEDTDDCLRFTAKAPEGQLFTGRFWNGNLVGVPQPITVQSQYAEIIYFLRNGNLYRRVLLVAPELQSTVTQAGGASPPFVPATFGGAVVSWQGVNDLSARPLASGGSVAGGNAYIKLNTLGDLTNRENRYASPRFANDFLTAGDGTYAHTPDGLPDDANADSVPDFWPSLYYNLFKRAAVVYSPPGLTPTLRTLLNEQYSPFPAGADRPYATLATAAFPYIYPYAYTKPDPTSVTRGLGWIHSVDPGNDLSTIPDLNAMNHAPLEVGDSLPYPSPTGQQTWWGFPTWRETLSPGWTDPFQAVSSVGQSPGLVPFAATARIPLTSTQLLPPLTTSHFGAASNGLGTPFRLSAQPFMETAGINAALGGPGSLTFAASPAPDTADHLWSQSWEDDLIMTGVRSFDVKAYDNSFPGYVDLGWGDDGRNWLPYYPNTTPQWTLYPKQANTPSLVGTIDGGQSLFTAGSFVWPPVAGGTSYDQHTIYNSTFAHEGRIPPLINDNRLDAQYGTLNVGDDALTTIRLRRVWDSWSTDYSNAPGTGVSRTGLPLGPPFPMPGYSPTFSMPVYPSYPAPYPMPLRGLQIQIRVVDPRNERTKVLTIKQDFSDKL